MGLLSVFLEEDPPRLAINPMRQISAEQALSRGRTGGRFRAGRALALEDEGYLRCRTGHQLRAGREALLADLVRWRPAPQTTRSPGALYLPAR